MPSSGPSSCCREDSHPFPGHVALIHSWLIATRKEHHAVTISPVSILEIICFRLGYKFLLNKFLSFLAFPHFKSFHKGLVNGRRPGPSSSISPPAKAGATFFHSGGCPLLSVRMIDPCMEDLLQGFHMYFFSPSWTSFGGFAAWILSCAFSALAILHCNSLAWQCSQKLFNSGDQAG